MASVATVPMHEEVHEWAKEERHIKEYAQDMGAMLGEQQRAGNDEEAQQSQSRRRPKKTTFMTAGVVVQRHLVCLKLESFQLPSHALSPNTNPCQPDCGSHGLGDGHWSET